MPIDRQVPLLFLSSKKGSIQFYIPIFRLPLSAHSFLSFYISSFVFASLFHASFLLQLNPVNEMLVFRLCIFVDFVSFSRFILLFHEYIEDLQSKMCLCAPYLKNYVFCILVYLFIHTNIHT